MSLQAVEQETQQITSNQYAVDRLTEIITILADRYDQGIYYTKDLDTEIDTLHQQLNTIKGGQ